MRRKFSIPDSATARIAASRCAVAMTAFAVLWIGAVDLCARDGLKDWIVLNNCRLIANPANDGDSFHVSAGAKEYIFRLYFVDAPETDEMTPRRLVEQAKYFGITVPQAIEVGRAAKEFTRARLSGPFSVFTHLSDAMGQSRLERFYAYVQTKEGDLGEQLVRNGLARIYGFKAVPPGLRNSRVELEKLQQLENQARQEKIGGWGVGVGRLNVRARQSRFSFFLAAETPEMRATPVPRSPAPSFQIPPSRPPGAPNALLAEKGRTQKRGFRLARSTSTQRQKKS
jgi:endonuclease YncB( thermonuclease family)